MGIQTYEQGSLELFKLMTSKEETFVWILKEEPDDLFSLLNTLKALKKPQWIFTPNKKTEEAISNLCTFFKLSYNMVTKKRNLAEETSDLYLGNVKDFKEILLGKLSEVNYQGVFTLGVAKEDFSSIVEDLREEYFKGFICALCSSREEAYELKDQVAKDPEEVYYLVPEASKELNIFIRGVEEEESILTISSFRAKDSEEFVLGKYLRKIFKGLVFKNQLKDYFDNIFLTAGEQLTTLSGREISLKAINGEYSKFVTRNLKPEEKIELLLLDEEYGKVVGKLTEAFRQPSYDSAVLKNAALYVYKYGSIEEAIECLEEVLKNISEDVTELKIALGKLYNIQGEYLKSRDIYFSIVGNRERGIETLVLGGEYQEALKSIRGILDDGQLEESIKNKLDFFYLLCCNEKKQFEEAFKYLEGIKEKSLEINLLEVILTYNQGKVSQALELINKTLTNKEVRDNSKLFLLATYLKTEIIKEEHKPGEAIKLYNTLLEKALLEKDNNYRKWRLVSYLGKSSNAKKEAKIFESINILEEGIRNYKYDQELKSLVGKMYQEKALSQKNIENFKEALDSIEEGLECLDEEKSIYSQFLKARLLLYKMECLEALGRPYENIKEALKALVVDNLDKEEFRVIDAESLLLKATLDFKNSQENTALKASEELYQKYQNSEHLEIKNVVLSALILEKDWVSNKKSESQLVEVLVKITKTFKAPDYVEGFLERGDGLYLLAKLCEDKGYNDESLKYLEIFLEDYEVLVEEEESYAPLKPFVLEGLLKKAKLLLNSGEIDLAKEDLSSLKEKTLKEESEEAYLAEVDYLLAMIEEKKKNTKEAIELYEEYLEAFEAQEDEGERVKLANYSLGLLYKEIEKYPRALKCFEEVILRSRDQETDLYYRALKGQGDVLRLLEKSESVEIYTELIKKIEVINNTQILLELGDVYLYLISQGIIIQERELEKYFTQLKTLEGHEGVIDKIEFDLLNAFSDKMELLDNLEEEKAAREIFKERFREKTSLRNQKAMAKTYYRLLVLEIKNGSTDKIQASYQELVASIGENKEPLVTEYLRQGSLMYGEEMFKKGDHQLSKELFLAEKKEVQSMVSYYYLGMIAEKENKPKSAKKIYQEALDLKVEQRAGEQKPFFYKICLRFLDLLTEEANLFNMGKKKALKTLEKEYLPLFEQEDEKYLIFKIEGIYRQGQWLMELNKKSQGEDIYRQAIPFYEGEEQEDIKLIIDKMYKCLESQKEV